MFTKRMSLPKRIQRQPASPGMPTQSLEQPTAPRNIPKEAARAKKDPTPTRLARDADEVAGKTQLGSGPCHRHRRLGSDAEVLAQGKGSDVLEHDVVGLEEVVA